METLTEFTGLSIRLIVLIIGWFWIGKRIMGHRNIERTTYDRYITSPWWLDIVMQSMQRRNPLMVGFYC